MAPTDAGSTGSVPAGWYPDPAGNPQWRRWDGTTWADVTMPYAPPSPDPAWVVREQLTWTHLRAVAPFALLAPAAAAVALASQTAAYAPLRAWVRIFWSDELHNRPVPPIPQVHTPPLATATNFAVWVAVLVGLLSWSRFAAASIRVAGQAGYSQRHHPTLSSLSLLLPFVGPVIAWSVSRSNLPTGHEARRVLDLGWWLVVVGEVAFVGVYASVWSSPSLALAWAVTTVCVVAWVLAALELPAGLGAIAQDHESLRVRRTTPPS